MRRRSQRDLLFRLASGIFPETTAGHLISRSIAEKRGLAPPNVEEKLISPLAR